MAFRSTLQRLAPLPSRIISLASANAGLLAMIVAVVAAGVLVFYLVILPPGSMPYP